MKNAILKKSIVSLPDDAANAVPQMYVHDVRNDAKDVDLLTPEGSLVGPSAYGSLKQSKSTTTNIPNLPNAVNPISGTPHDYAALLAELRMSEEEFLGR